LSESNPPSSGDVPEGIIPSGCRSFFIRWAFALAAGVVGIPSQAPNAAADPAPSGEMHPMARDMLDRLLQAARAEPDVARRRASADKAVQEIPRAFYGLILDGIPSPVQGSAEHAVADAVFLRWAWETPDFAAAWAVSSHAGAFRDEALAEAAGRWATKDTADALRWVRTLSPEDRRRVLEQAPRFMDGASPASLHMWQQATQAPT
jgi:hypothetical protein